MPEESKVELAVWKLLGVVIVGAFFGGS